MFNVTHIYLLASCNKLNKKLCFNFATKNKKNVRIFFYLKIRNNRQTKTCNIKYICLKALNLYAIIGVLTMQIKYDIKLRPTCSENLVHLLLSESQESFINRSPRENTLKYAPTRNSLNNKINLSTFCAKRNKEIEEK